MIELCISYQTIQHYMFLVGLVHGLDMGITVILLINKADLIMKDPEPKIRLPQNQHI